MNRDTRALVACPELLVRKLVQMCVLLLLLAPLRSNGAEYVLPLFIIFNYFFIHRSFPETTRPILTKFSGIVYSGVD